LCSDTVLGGSAHDFDSRLLGLFQWDELGNAFWRTERRERETYLKVERRIMADLTYILLSREYATHMLFEPESLSGITL
jgi:hypothetical protein